MVVENGGDNPAAEHHEIALAVESLRKNYDSAQADRAKPTPPTPPSLV
jgi:hypothetical protein